MGNFAARALAVWALSVSTGGWGAVPGLVSARRALVKAQSVSVADPSGAPFELHDRRAIRTLIGSLGNPARFGESASQCDKQVTLTFNDARLHPLGTVILCSVSGSFIHAMIGGSDFTDLSVDQAARIVGILNGAAAPAPSLNPSCPARPSKLGRTCDPNQTCDFGRKHCRCVPPEDGPCRGHPRARWFCYNLPSRQCPPRKPPVGEACAVRRSCGYRGCGWSATLLCQQGQWVLGKSRGTVPP